MPVNLTADAGIEVSRCGKKIQDQDGDQADAKLDGRIDPKRMQGGGNDAGEGEAAEAHPAHKSSQ